MKQKFLLCLCAFALAVSIGTMAGCGSEESTRNVDLSSIASSIEAYDNGYFTKQSIAELKTEYDIDSGDVKQFVAEKKDGTVIVMIEATSSDAANRIAEKLTSYVSSYSRDGVDQVVKHGDYVAWFYSSAGKDDDMANAFSNFVTAD